MENFETLQKFQEEMASTVIAKLVWISATHPRYLFEFLEDMNDKEHAKIMPDVNISDLSKYDCATELCEKGYYGFIAECHIPVPDNISFDSDGVVSGYTSSIGHCRIFNAYGHTIDELTQSISATADNVFNEMVEKYKEKYK